MMEQQDHLNLQRLSERVAILESQSLQISSLIIKLETTIDKLAEVSNSLREFTAVQDHRLRIVEEELEINTRRDQANIHDRDVESRRFESAVATMTAELKNHMINEEDTMTHISETLSSMNERVAALEKWRYVVVGGAAVLYFLFQFGSKLLASL